MKRFLIVTLVLVLAAMVGAHAETWNRFNKDWSFTLSYGYGYYTGIDTFNNGLMEANALLLSNRDNFRKEGSSSYVNQFEGLHSSTYISLEMGKAPVDDKATVTPGFLLALDIIPTEASIEYWDIVKYTKTFTMVYYILQIFPVLTFNLDAYMAFQIGVGIAPGVLTGNIQLNSSFLFSEDTTQIENTSCPTFGYGGFVSFRFILFGDIFSGMNLDVYAKYLKAWDASDASYDMSSPAFGVNLSIKL